MSGRAHTGKRRRGTSEITGVEDFSFAEPGDRNDEWHHPSLKQSRHDTEQSSGADESGSEDGRQAKKRKRVQKGKKITKPKPSPRSRDENDDDPQPPHGDTQGQDAEGIRYV